MKVRSLAAIGALVAAARAFLACVGSDPNEVPSSPDGGGEDAPSADTGGSDAGGGGVTDADSSVEPDAADADDGAPKCPTSIPAVIPGVHCPDNPNGMGVCLNNTYCCSAPPDGGGRACLNSGSVCAAMTGTRWQCEAITQCNTNEVCEAAVVERDGGCPHEFDLPYGVGTYSKCIAATSQAAGTKQLCDPNGGTQCLLPATCKPAIMHFPDSTTTFVVGMCL